MRCYAFLIGLTLAIVCGTNSARAQSSERSISESTRRGAPAFRLIQHSNNQDVQDLRGMQNLDEQEPTVIKPDEAQDLIEQENAPRTLPGETPESFDSNLQNTDQVNPNSSSVLAPAQEFRSPPASNDACPDCDYDVQGSSSDPYGCGYDSCRCNMGFDDCYQRLFPCYKGWSVGGWLQTGYHNESTGLLNNRPDELNLHQGWFTLERKANNNCCGWDWGFRFDAVYGTDAFALQSFGNNPDTYDFQNGQDHGAYAWAFPQLYAEVRSGNWSIKGGHFLADFNHETYRSPTNFFYSRSYASVLSSPATLSGMVASYDDGQSIWSAGYTAGWDTGFDTFLNGGSFYGSVKRRLSNRSSISYTTMAGDFGRRGDGYSHSIIYDRNIGCRWNYAFETSYLQSDLVGGGRNDNVGIAQYLTYRWSDKVDLGQRLEWWKSDINNAGSQSTYAYTAGLNYRVNSNITVRPEARYNWGAQFNNASMQNAALGIDAVIRF